MLSTTKAPLQISFGKEKYVIEATDSGVFLQKGQQKTRLSGLSAGGADSEDAVSLLWAGDLDRDGGLDLVFAYSGHNNSGVCLYLSAGADKGALVQQAACHGGVGC